MMTFHSSVVALVVSFVGFACCLRVDPSVNDAPAILDKSFMQSSQPRDGIKKKGKQPRTIETVELTPVGSGTVATHDSLEGNVARQPVISYHVVLGFPGTYAAGTVPRLSYVSHRKHILNSPWAKYSVIVNDDVLSNEELLNKAGKANAASTEGQNAPAMSNVFRSIFDEAFAEYKKMLSERYSCRVRVDVSYSKLNPKSPGPNTIKLYSRTGEVMEVDYVYLGNYTIHLSMLPHGSTGFGIDFMNFNIRRPENFDWKQKEFFDVGKFHTMVRNTGVVPRECEGLPRYWDLVDHCKKQVSAFGNLSASMMGKPPPESAENGNIAIFDLLFNENHKYVQTYDEEYIKKRQDVRYDAPADTLAPEPWWHLI